MDEQPTPEVPEKKPKKTVGIPTTIGIAVIVGLASFVGGMRAESLPVFNKSQNSKIGNNLDFSSVEETYDLLRSEFDGQLDAQKLIDGAKKGLVEATGDPYTTYFTDAEAQQFLGDLEGKFTGIGAELDKKESNLIIVSTLDDSPARKAGLMPNDVIAKVNDEETTGWTTDKAVSQIRGEKGTTVKLTILRSATEVKEISIVRAEIVNPSVKAEVTPDNVGILRISRFAEGDTVNLTRKAALDFKAKNVKGVVLDLRGNGGGYLNAAQEIAGIWLNNKTVVQERRGDEVTDTLKTGNTAILEGVPTVVLVDGGSASASEILAGALQDNDAAQLVGMKTFGKGSVQQITKVPSGGQLKVTIAKWYTPKGKNITKEGIEPNVKVELGETDLQNNRDPQRDKAVELLKNR